MRITSVEVKKRRWRKYPYGDTSKSSAEYDLYSQYVMPQVVDIMRCLLQAPSVFVSTKRAERFKFCLENNSLQLSIYISFFCKTLM